MMQLEWPLVGRAEELRRIAKSCREGRGTVLAGPTGVGKTRVANELIPLIERAGLGVVWVSGTRSASGIPFGALATLLPALDIADVDEMTGRADLFRRSADALLKFGTEAGLVVVVDDAHLLDDASATLFHQLAVNRAVVLVASVRTGETVPESITALWKDGFLERHDVGSLSHSSIGRLLERALDGTVDPSAVRRLFQLCQGNVLFLRELILGAIECGALTSEWGVWTLARSFEPSHRLVELVEARFQQLDPDERELAALIAYAEPMDVAELESLGKIAVAEVLESKGLVVTRLDGNRLQVRLAHPLYGEVVRCQIPALRMRMMARVLADTVEQGGMSRPEDTLRVARWRLDAGGGSHEMMLRAATFARWTYQFELAERLVQAAIESGGGFEASLLEAQLASLQGRPLEAEQRLARLASSATDDAERGVVAVRRFENLVLSLGRNTDGARVLDEAESVVTDQGWALALAARRPTLLLHTEGFAAAAAGATHLLDDMGSLRRAEAGAAVWACQTGAFGRARQGRAAEALTIADLGVDLVAGLDGYDWYQWMPLWIRCEVLTLAGRFEEAEAIARSQYELGLDEESPEARAYFAWALCRTVAERGHLSEAVAIGREAVVLLRRLGRPAFMAATLVQLALALSMAGEAEEADRTFEELDAVSAEPMMWISVDLAIARAWREVLREDIPAAERFLREAAEHGGSTGDLVGAASALHTLARIGLSQGCGDELRRLAGSIEGDLITIQVDHAHALEEGDPAGLLDASQRFERIGAMLLAAEAAIEASELWARAENALETARAERRANTLVQNLERIPTAGLSHHATGQDQALLTPDERATAVLAAMGRSNKEIAEEQFLSVRTVENRLRRVYKKIGVSSRSDLSSLVS